MNCRHCHVRPVSRPRGLCYRCFYTPAVRALYPSTSKFGLRGVGGGPSLHDAGPPAAPTAAPPGSAAKVEELARRAALRQRLWHPADRNTDGLPASILHEGGQHHVMTNRPGRQRGRLPADAVREIRRVMASDPPRGTAAALARKHRCAYSVVRGIARGELYRAIA